MKIYSFKNKKSFIQKFIHSKMEIGKSKIRPFSTVRPIKHSMGLSLIYGCSPFGVYPYPLDRHSVVPSPTKRNTPKAGHWKSNMLEKLYESLEQRKSFYGKDKVIFKTLLQGKDKGVILIWEGVQI